MSLMYVADNLRANGWFYLTDVRFPAVYTALALLGLFAIPIKSVPLIGELTVEANAPLVVNCINGGPLEAPPM